MPFHLPPPQSHLHSAKLLPFCVADLSQPKFPQQKKITPHKKARQRKLPADFWWDL